MIRQRRIQSIETWSADQGTVPRRAWIETVVVTVLLPVVGWLINTRDPFFVRGFPWVVLAPLLLGLQNGFRHGLVSGVSLIAGALAHGRIAHTTMGSFPIDYLLSMGLIGPLAGEYRDRWQRAIEVLRREHGLRGQRLEQFTRAYHLLERSHNDLEQRMAGGGRSLAGALAQIEVQLTRQKATPLAQAGESILELFSHYGQVQVASLHETRPGTRTGKATEAPGLELDPRPIAALGNVPDVDLGHPMVLDALATHELTSAREERAAARGSALLVCVPLVDSRDHLWGMLLVHEMPFLAMSNEAMKLLGVLGGRVGDWLDGGAGASMGAQASKIGEAMDRGEQARAAGRPAEEQPEPVAASMAQDGSVAALVPAREQGTTDSEPAPINGHSITEPARALEPALQADDAGSRP